MLTCVALFCCSFDRMARRPRTALFDTLGQWADDIEGLATIWLFSDLLESVIVSADDLLQGKTDFLNRSRGRLAALDQIDVHIAGFGRFHDPGRRPLTADEQASLDRQLGQVHSAERRQAPCRAGFEGERCRQSGAIEWLRLIAPDERIAASPTFFDH